MSLSSSKMSPVEHNFVKTYVRALRRDYDIVITVESLMDTDYGLSVSKLLSAVFYAKQLRDMHADFVDALKPIVDKNLYVPGPSLQWPPVDSLSRLFSLSFFTMVTRVDGEPVSSAGLFSGAPEEWAHIIPDVRLLKAILRVEKNSVFTGMQKAAKQLFNELSLFSEIFNSFPPPPKQWPIPEEPTIDDEMHFDYDDDAAEDYDY